MASGGRSLKAAGTIPPSGKGSKSAARDRLLGAMCPDPSREKPARIRDWECYRLPHTQGTENVVILRVVSCPRGIADVKAEMRGRDAGMVLLEDRNMLYLKASAKTYTFTMDSDGEYLRMASILAKSGVAEARGELRLMVAITHAINAIPTDTGDFDNRGLFSTYYMRNRLFEGREISEDVESIERIVKEGGSAHDLLKGLKWDLKRPEKYDGTVSITVTSQDNLSTRGGGRGEASPSYTAVSTLQNNTWAILTNGKTWRLYSSRESASATNFFEISLGPEAGSAIRYLVAVFAASTFEAHRGAAEIDKIYEGGRTYARDLEENIAKRIMTENGVFVKIVKGVLDHSLETSFSSMQLEAARQAALKIMYRVWFIAYAESRNLLPVRDKRYAEISLREAHSDLDKYGEDPGGDGCWRDLCVLFEGIKKGSKKHNLPQYDGELFRHDPSVDGISIRNSFMVEALRGLLEKDGEPMDFGNLKVRHLGTIFENLMEFTVRQAKRDVMLIRDRTGLREVSAKEKSGYFYPRNDLYLSPGSGAAARRSSGSFYTPEEIVQFLVRRGLEPILGEREGMLGADMEEYRAGKKDAKECIDRILDLQVLDPAMGSGHFLVEALNQITGWATNALKTHPDHPLMGEIESDMRAVLREQEEKGIEIDKNLLTHEVLLKRKVMKRCIFGVDVNPMAVELAKLSLWLDSFAIGVPLTYMDHHIRCGDSTIGAFLEDVERNGAHTLDDWLPGKKSNVLIWDVVTSPDVTVRQVQESEDRYAEHMRHLEPMRNVLNASVVAKMKPREFAPRKGMGEFLYRFAAPGKEDDDISDKRTLVSSMADQYRFFNWDVEMRDAFIDSRRGFDLIVGNPPWEKTKLEHDEFFTQYDPAFLTLTPNTKKVAKKNELLQDGKINKKYELYKTTQKEKNNFYSEYKLQGVGHKDLWQIILERALRLVADNGVISVLIPSQILSNIGGAHMRKKFLQMDIRSLYVIENRKKVFPIDSRYRFVLLTVRNSEGSDKFRAGFYLHDLKSLADPGVEKEKFLSMSKHEIAALSPNQCVISEADETETVILKKTQTNKTLANALGDGWSVKFSTGLNTTNDSDLFKEDKRGWPVLKGKNIHQYNHNFTNAQFTANKDAGLEREKRKRLYSDSHLKIFNSFRLVLRRVSSSTNMRTVISTIIPPHRFHEHSLYSVLLLYNNRITLDGEYIKKILYLCGVFNSITFDYLARTKVQMDVPSVIKSFQFPKNTHEEKIAKLSAKLVVGSPEFEGIADYMRIPNVPMSPKERIKAAARIDALVARSYGIDKEDYADIIKSFKAFKENPDLHKRDHVAWDNKSLKEFYGEVAKLAHDYFEGVEND